MISNLSTVLSDFPMTLKPPIFWYLHSAEKKERKLKGNKGKWEINKGKLKNAQENLLNNKFKE